MAPLVVLKRGDTRSVTFPLGVDLTTATAVRVLGSRDVTDELIIDRVIPEVDDTGDVTLEWEPGETAEIGTLLFEVKVTEPDGTVRTFPSSGFFKVQVDPDLSGLPFESLAPGISAQSLVEGVQAGLTEAQAGLTAVQAGLTSKQDTGIDATQRFMAVLANESRDLSLLVVSDSTANETAEWARRLTDSLAAAWPSWSVQYTIIDDVALSYPAPTSLQTGTGARTLTVYNCSVAGATTTYYQGAKFAPYISSLATPDLCLLSLSHNEGSVDYLWHPQMVGFTEQVAEAHPGMQIILVSGNPETANTYQQQRGEVYREIASVRSYGFIDVCQAFLDYGDYASIMADGVHPNATTGSALYASTVADAFRFQGSWSPRPQPPSTLNETGEQALVNGDFAAFTGAIPDGWIASSGTLVASKDVTNYESPNGYAVKLIAGAAGDNLYQSLSVKKYAGKWLTIVARVYVPSGGTSTAGRIALVDSTGSTVANANAWGKGAFRWAVISRKISSAATFIRALLYSDSGTIGGNATYDQIVVIPGRFPRRAANAQRGLPGAAGAAGGSIPTTDLDFMSTFGPIPGTWLLGMAQSAACRIANQAILVKFKPTRNITLTGLWWATGGTSTGNYDIGVYDDAGNRLWSRGSTAWPAVSTAVTENVSPSVALIGNTVYWIAFCGDNITALYRGVASAFSSQLLDVSGVPLSRAVSAAFPLPASLALGSTDSLRLPAIRILGT